MSFQVNSTLLDACVLSILSQGDTYGYKITQEIKIQLGISESTLYPVLRRLSKEHYLETYDKEVDGRNRRYYTITQEGNNKLLYYKNAWKEYVGNISAILMRGEIND